MRPRTKITEEQKAEIASLQQAIEKLHYRRVRFYSTLITLFLPNIIIRFAVLPLVKYADSDYVKLQKSIADLARLEEKEHRKFTSEMLEFCSQEHINDNCIEEAAGKYDFFENKYFQSSQRSLTLSQSREITNHLSKLQDKAWWLKETDHLLISLELKNPGLQHKKIRDQIGKLNEPIPVKEIDIYEGIIVREKFLPLAKRLAELHHQYNLKGAKKYFLHFVDHHLISLVREHFILLFSVNFVMQRKLVEPSVFKLYRFRLKNQLLVKPDMSCQDAKDLIKNLEAKKEDLENTALFSPRGLGSLAIGAFLLGYFIDISMLEAALFVITLLFVAVPNLRQILNDQYEQRRSNAAFKSTLNNLNKIIPGWGPRDFTWNAQRHENLSAPYVCQLVKNSLIKHGLGDAIIFDGYKTITLRPDIKLTDAKAEELKAEISGKLYRHTQIKKFRLQLKELGEAIARFSFSYTFELGLPILKFKLQIPAHLSQFLTPERLEKVFPQPNYRCSISNGTLNILGHGPVLKPDLDNQLLSPLRKLNLEHFHHHAMQSHIVTTSDHKHASVPKGRFTPVSAPVEPKKQPIDKKDEKAPTIIKWKSATYNANDPKCKITRIGKSNKFKLFNLSKTDFPDTDSHKKFHDIFDREKEARGFDNQGWRRMNSVNPYQKRDKKGIWQTCSFNLKAKGQYAGIHVYGITELDETGQFSLDNANHVDTSGHRGGKF